MRLFFAFQNIDLNSVPRHSSGFRLSHTSLYLLPEATRLTTIEVEVDELWTSTVTKIPTTRPATGLDSITLSWKMSPATFPGLVCSVHAHRDRKHTQKLLVCDMTGLPRAMLDKIQSACFHISEKVTDEAVYSAALPQWDTVNSFAVAYLYVKHQQATYPLPTGRPSSECPRSRQRGRGGRRGEGSWIWSGGAALSFLRNFLVYLLKKNNQKRSLSLIT